MKLVMFSRVKPRGFQYKPIHYDPVKEAREERRKELLGDDYAPLGQQKEEKERKPGDLIRARGIRRESMGIHSREAQKKRVSATRAFVALGVLILLAIWMFTSK